MQSIVRIPRPFARALALMAMLAVPLGPASAQSNGTIRGRIMDATTQRPLSDAQVSVQGTSLGAITLGATVLALDAFRSWAPMGELGEGGLERWIVYPIVLWLVAFGSYLMSTPATRSPHDRSRTV